MHLPRNRRNRKCKPRHANGMACDHPNLSDPETVTKLRRCVSPSHNNRGIGRLEPLRCVRFWPWAFWSPSVLLPTPQSCITPNRGTSSLVPPSLWTLAFRRSFRTRPPATTIHPSLAAADLRRGALSAESAGGGVIQPIPGLFVCPTRDVEVRGGRYILAGTNDEMLTRA